MAHVQLYTTASGARRYRVRWLDGSGRKRSKTFIRKRDADLFATERQREQSLGVLYEAPSVTLREFTEGWKERYRSRVRQSTYDRFLEILPHLEQFMPRPLESITAAEVEDAVTELAQRAPRQAQLVLQALKQILSNAKTRGYRINEAIVSLRSPKTEARERRFLSWQQVELLATNTPEPHDNLIKLAALSGLRQGELLALTDQDVDLQLGTIRVERNAYKGQLVPLKTKASRRSVDLSQEARRVIRQQLLARKPNDLGLIFPSATGLVINDDNFRNRIFKPACRRSGLSDLAFHDLRHTYAALMVAAGANAKYLQTQMGHSSVRTTLDLYGHLFPDANSQVLTAFDALTSPRRDHHGTMAGIEIPISGLEPASLQGNADGAYRDRTGDLRLAKTTA